MYRVFFNYLLSITFHKTQCLRQICTFLSVGKVLLLTFLGCGALSLPPPLPTAAIQPPPPLTHGGGWGQHTVESS